MTSFENRERLRRIAVAALLVAAATVARAQDVKEIVFDEAEVADDQSFEDLDAFEAKLRDADGAVMAYLRASAGAVEQGHARGVESFKVWYRKWEHAKRNANTSVAEALLKSVFSVAIKAVFPEGTAFEQLLAAIAKESSTLAIGGLKQSNGDVNLFLDQIAEAEGKYIEQVHHAPERLRREHEWIFEAAKADYVWYVKDTTKLPPAARNYLLSVGILEGTEATTRRVKEAVLTAHIEAVYRADGACAVAGIPTHIAAEMTALRYLDEKANLARICKLDRTLNPILRYYRRGECPGDDKL